MKSDYQTATPESVWAAILALTEKQAETDRQMKKTDEIVTKLAGKVQNMDDMVGGMANSNGMFAEEFFFNSIDSSDKKLFGEHFYECYCSSKRYSKSSQKKSEHDILLVNGEAVAIVEVKYRARQEDIEKIINKLPDFRVLYPQYQSYRTYLGLAAMAFDKGVEDKAIESGLAIVKQVGDTFVINDENLKVF